jgi:hypothetical protein
VCTFRTSRAAWSSPPKQTTAPQPRSGADPAGLGRASLRTGEDDRRRREPEQPVDEVDGLLHGVGAVRDDDAVPPTDVLAHAPGEREAQVAVHVEARHVREVVELDRRRVRPADRLEQLSAADRRHELARPGVRPHRDRPAGRDDDDAHVTLRKT